MANAIYRQNFHAEEVRQHQSANSWRFGAATDAAALALATAVAAKFSGKETSVTKEIVTGAAPAAWTVGTRYSVSVLLQDANYRVYRQHIRNHIHANPGDYLTALFTGIASADAVIVALGAPPALPRSLSPITIVNFAESRLPG